MTTKRKDLTDHFPERWPSEAWLAMARANPTSAWIAEDARIQALRYTRRVAGRLLRRWALRPAATLARRPADRKEPRERAWSSSGHR